MKKEEEKKSSILGIFQRNNERETPPAETEAADPEQTEPETETEEPETIKTIETESTDPEPAEAEATEPEPGEADRTDEAEDGETEIKRLRKELLEARAALAEAKGAIEAARLEGIREGRNARIEEFLKTEPGDGLPSTGPSSASRPNVDSIFSLAADAR